MNFKEAMELLEAGEAVRRESWDDKDWYIEIRHDDNDQKSIWKCDKVSPGADHNENMLDGEDFFATDWVAVNLLYSFEDAWQALINDEVAIRRKDWAEGTYLARASNGKIEFKSVHQESTETMTINLGIINLNNEEWEIRRSHGF